METQQVYYKGNDAHTASFFHYRKLVDCLCSESLFGRISGEKRVAMNCIVESGCVFLLHKWLKKVTSFRCGCFEGYRWAVCGFYIVLQKLTEDEIVVIDKICKEEVNIFGLLDPDVVRGLYRRGLVYLDVPVFPDDYFKGDVWHVQIDTAK